MIFDATRAEKSLKKLRKSLVSLSKRPPPKQVHSLRTRIRRVEAVIDAQTADRSRDGKRLLRALKPIRKRAGRVRDIDVFIGFAATLKISGERDCLLQLIEYLGSARAKSVRRLHHALAVHSQEARRHIRHYSGYIRKHLSGSAKNTLEKQESSAEATAKAAQIWSEMTEWPRLNHTNLHPFRLKVKELRYILQLDSQSDPQFVSNLGEVNDAIGEWHDWNELAAIASNVLHHGDRCALKKQIQTVAQEKQQDAFSAARALRKKYQATQRQTEFPLF